MAHNNKTSNHSNRSNPWKTEWFITWNSRKTLMTYSNRSKYVKPQFRGDHNRLNWLNQKANRNCPRINQSDTNRHHKWTESNRFWTIHNSASIFFELRMLCSLDGNRVLSLKFPSILIFYLVVQASAAMRSFCFVEIGNCHDYLYCYIMVRLDIWLLPSWVL